MVVAERLADPEVGEDRGGDAAVQGLQRGGGADRDQQGGAVQGLAPVPVDQAGGGRQAGLLGQLLVGQLLDVGGVFAGLGAQLEQHLAFGVQPGVPDQPVQQVRAVRAAVRDGRLGGEHHGVRLVFTGVRRSAEERQGPLGDRRRVRAHALVHGAEPLGVLAGVGEHQVRPVPQQQPVGELFVDDADVPGDDDGPPGAALPDPLQAVQHRLDAAADEGEDEDVVRLLARGRLVHGTQELHGAHLAEGVRADADLRELAGGGSGAAPQEVAVEPEVRALGGFEGFAVLGLFEVSGLFGDQAPRGERAPFPPGVGIRENGDAPGLLRTCWHVEDRRKAFLGSAQPECNNR